MSQTDSGPSLGKQQGFIHINKYLPILPAVHWLLCWVVKDVKIIKAGFLPSFKYRT